ncbi:hypothetical protein Vi05172_g12607 [Venturia inaequalis]|nr:hypothetical protein Vi05172_g12607 [Venturia inaequalis]
MVDMCSQQVSQSQAKDKDLLNKEPMSFNETT